MRSARPIRRRAIVARFRELGGRAVTAGSDAHRPDWFAWGLDEGYGSWRRADFAELTFRRGRDPVERRIAGAVRPRGRLREMLPRPRP